MTIAELQTQRDDLLRKLSGIEDVRHDGAGVTFKRADEMRTQLALIDAEIARLSGESGSRVFTVVTSRGI
ncbi:MAG: hypothetical protein JNL98_21240 [Bryobacterales bacterium]|nr:hypothetical protein [Bryobacterales bacterium]